MDLNYLYHRQQVAQFCADQAGCAQSRDAHQAMADAYGVLINQSKNSGVQVRA